MHGRTFHRHDVRGHDRAVRGSARGQSAEAGSSLKPLPRRDPVRVAFMLGDGANVIDTTGPWEVFQDTMVHVDGERRNASSCTRWGLPRSSCK